MIRKRVAPGLAALALVLAIAAPVAAVETTTPETLTVAASITVTGLPASIAYGTAPAGGTTGDPLGTANTIVNIASNAPWQLVVTQSNFTANGNTIDKSNRQMKFENPGGSGGVTIVAAATSFIGGNNAVWGSPVITGGTGNTSFAPFAYVTVPSGAVAGNYTGSIVWNFTAIP